MLSWFRRKQKTNPAAWVPPASGNPRFRSLTEELALANAEARRLRDNHQKMETVLLNVTQERDHLKDMLWNFYRSAIRVQASKNTPLDKWEPSPEHLPSRAMMHEFLVNCLTKVITQNFDLSNQVDPLKAQVKELTAEVQQLRAERVQAVNERFRLEGEVAYAMGELGLARDAQNLAERKVEYLYDEWAKLSPHFKNMSAEKVAAKAAKDAAKAVVPPINTPAIDPPTAPEVWPVKPKR